METRVTECFSRFIATQHVSIQRIRAVPFPLICTRISRGFSSLARVLCVAFDTEGADQQYQLRVDAYFESAQPRNEALGPQTADVSRRGALTLLGN